MTWITNNQNWAQLLPLILLNLPGGIYFLRKRQFKRFYVNLCLNTGCVLYLFNNTAYTEAQDNLVTDFVKIAILLCAVTTSSAITGFAASRSVCKTMPESEKGKATHHILEIGTFIISFSLYVAINSACLLITAENMEEKGSHHHSGSLPCW